MKKTQLQNRIDQVKTQYAALLTEMQDLQTKLTEGQQSLKTLSDEYMKAVSQTPTPSELPAVSGEGEQIPMAVESFVHSLGISLTEEQKSQLHGLLKRPNQDQEDPTKRRKTDVAPLAPGWTFPVPDDDIMSCEGQDSPNTQHSIEDVFVFEAAPQSLAEPLQPQWVCRAATGSQQQRGKTSQLCAGEHAQHTADTSSFGMTLNSFEGDHSKDSPRHNLHPEDNSFSSFATSDHVAGAQHGGAYLSILGGASDTFGTTSSSDQQGAGVQNYATATDCILQNLTMVVGNPSVRCHANAPWRAFTWVCALLQETSTQPWGTLQEAVQESIDTAEQVDLQNLPGLNDLWKRHDLNVQGDASHFVNSLWLLSQSRAFHYRFAEIKEGGYLTDHVQQPMLVNYPDDWPDDVTFQQLINNWANVWASTSWTTRKWSSVM